MSDSCCGNGGCCSGSNERSVFSKEERLEMLKEYKVSLEKELKAVNEQMKELQK